MTIKKHIPNLLTLGNLLSGVIATIFAVKGDYQVVAIFVMLGIVFDFFDGFVARLLNISGELGKQLDSLADMVTSGVVPGIVLYKLLEQTQIGDFSDTNFLPYIGLLITLAACYRLANFNIDTRQTDSFIGLPTPAMALFVISLPLVVANSEYHFFVDLAQNSYFLIGVTVLFSYLMNAEIPLFALKFKTFGLKENGLKYLFLLASVLFIVFLQFIAIPLIIVLYVLVSFLVKSEK